MGVVGVGAGRRRKRMGVYFPSTSGFDGRFVRN